MRAPPKYPRVPHLVATDAATPDDLSLGAGELSELLHTECIVEEKLDGANVVIWVENEIVQVASRGGPGAMDRGQVLHRVRPWVLERSDRLVEVLGSRLAVYGEWLLARHAIAYRRLPALLVGFDVFDLETQTFLPLSERELVLERAGIATPPRVFEGKLNSVEFAESLIGKSRVGDDLAEGIVVRPLATGADVPRVAKLVRDDFRPVPGSDRHAGENLVIASSNG